MNASTLLLAPVIVPLLLAVFVLPFFRRNPKIAAALILLSVVVSGLSFWMATASAPKVEFSWVENFTLSFSLNSWKTFLLCFVFLFQFMTAVYSLGASKPARPYLYPFSLLIAFSSTCMVLLTDSLLVLLVGWEMFLVALYLMIHSGGEKAEPVARKALVIGGASDFLMILGLMLFFTLAPDHSMSAGIAISSSPMAFWSFFLIFLGAGAKAGMFPFHTWIPDAAEVMPAAGFAAMPASLEKVLGIYFLFVLTSQMFVLDAAARGCMFVLGIATIFVSIIPALAEKDLRKVLALTAISPVGFMVCGMAVSDAAGFAGALLYMLTHATYKSAMFFSLGNFEEKAGGSQLRQLLGIARRMPLSATGFFLAFVAAISLPPTGGFMAKELIFEGALEGKHILVLAFLVIGAILNVAVFAKVIAVLWARGAGSKNEATGTCVIPAVLLGVAALVGGFFFQRADGLLREVTGAHESGLLSNVWHFSPLTVVSLAIFTLGFMVYAAARSGRETAAETFSPLTTSPVLGPALRLASERKFDGYDVGLKVVEFTTRIVFRYVERMIDVVGQFIIDSGRWLLRPVLSGAHNGLYGNYLCWTVLGFVFVLFYLFGSALLG
ncbi:MAG TPA: proton-conducting transporter membrane subunit [Acidobacteriota bacterium]|nr:proton-conducting transporter membrane subunit [Acidobacteriota bacterium]